MDSPAPRPVPEPEAQLASQDSRPSPAADVESLIGGRWFAVGGALMFVIGIVFLVRLAVAEGWFGGLPAWAKCLTASAIGVGVLVAAERVRGKLNGWALIGLNAAGLGALYVSAYAAFGVYELVGAPVAAAMLAACTAIGVAVSARTKLVGVAIVALIGGYVSPMFLGSGAGAGISPLLTPLNYGMLLLTGLVLSTGLGGQFMLARMVGWWGTLGLGAVWVLRVGAGDWLGVAAPAEAALGFVGAVWLAVHAELIWTSKRLDAGQIVPPTRAFSEKMEGWDVWRPVASSTATTAWAVGLAMTLTDDVGVARWVPCAIGAAISAACGFVMASGIRVLREVPRTVAERLGAGLTLQAGGLLVAAVAMSLTGWTQTVVWLALALSTVLSGRWIRSSALAWYGLAILGLCTVRLVMFDAWDPELVSHRVEFAGLILTRWTLLMATAGAAWALVAAVVRGVTKDELISPTAAGIGMLMTLGSVVNMNARSASIIAVWAVAAGILVVLARAMRSAALAWVSGAVWFAAMAVLLCTLPRDLDVQSDAVILPGTVASLAVAAIGLWILATVRTLCPKHPWIETAAALTGAAFVVATLWPMSVEVDRGATRLFADPTARRAAMSVWLAVYAVGTVAVGFWMRSSRLRLAGLMLLAAVGAKVLIFDLMGVSLLWRTVSFMATGVLMLGVAVVYGWLSRQLPAVPVPVPAEELPVAEAPATDGQDDVTAGLAEKLLQSRGTRP